MKIIIKMTYEELEDNWFIYYKLYGDAGKVRYPMVKLFEEVIKHGYNHFNGKINNIKEEWDRNIIYTYTPSYEDILFQRFERWVPEWKKKREILFRKF